MPPRPASRPAPLLCMFTSGMGDPDTWFHLRSGEYIWHNGALSLMAQRNIIFTGLIAPILIASYLPPWGAVPAVAHGTAFQLHVAGWKYPKAQVFGR